MSVVWVLNIGKVWTMVGVAAFLRTDLNVFHKVVGAWQNPWGGTAQESGGASPPALRHFVGWREARSGMAGMIEDSCEEEAQGWVSSQ